ncbi:MAG: RpiB/LacA/LacB family sugar-phosphate isomerase [Eubacteriales bacterium]|nr:RpiB/LacA/LacB family sugar-phosphate isomerase [Eubacteriales bacterium]
MKTIKDKQVLVAADFAGVEVKNAVVAHLEADGWTCTDIGVKTVDDPHPEMFHRIGLRVGAKIAEREFERALVFCGTGMGIHIAASKCPHVHAAVVESVHAAARAITGNNVNVLAMGGSWISAGLAIEIAEVYLYNNLGDGYDWWPNFYEFHKLAYDELDAFDYETFKKNGFTFPDAVDVPLSFCPRPDRYKRIAR